MSQQYKEKLYHGTVSEISRVDVSKGRGNKDFGKGFYMAVSKQQAVGMMHKKYREAVRRSRNKKNADFSEHLYQITLDTAYLEGLHVKQFFTIHGPIVRRITRSGHFAHWSLTPLS